MARAGGQTDAIVSYIPVYEAHIAYSKYHAALAAAGGPIARSQQRTGSLNARHHRIPPPHWGSVLPFRGPFGVRTE